MARNLVAAAFDCQQQVIAPRKIYGKLNVSRAVRLNDRGRAAVHHAVSECAGVVIAGISLADQPAAQRRFEVHRLYLGHVRRSAVQPFHRSGHGLRS